MRSKRSLTTFAVQAAAAFLLVAGVGGVARAEEADAPAAAAQAKSDAKPSMEIYGFAMLDIGQNF